MDNISNIYSNELFNTIAEPVNSITNAYYENYLFFLNQNIDLFFEYTKPLIKINNQREGNLENNMLNKIEWKSNYALEKGRKLEEVNMENTFNLDTKIKLDIDSVISAEDQMKAAFKNDLENSGKIQNYVLEKEENSVYKLRTIIFSIEVSQNSELFIIKMEVPLLALMHIPTFLPNSTDIKYKFEIYNGIEQNSDSENSIDSQEISINMENTNIPGVSWYSDISITDALSNNIQTSFTNELNANSSTVSINLSVKKTNILDGIHLLQNYFSSYLPQTGSTNYAFGMIKEIEGLNKNNLSGDESTSSTSGNGSNSNTSGDGSNNNTAILPPSSTPPSIPTPPSNPD